MTFETIKARTSREMKRGELSACATAVQSSILSAIKFYERRRFWFNEFVDTTITASASSTYTTLSVDVIVIDSMKAVINGRDYPLAKKTWNEIDAIDSGQFYGYPEWYSIHSKRIRLYPPPNQNTTLRMAGVYRLPEISAGATANATNEWVNECEEMIRLKAKSTLFRDELRNTREHNTLAGEAERVYRELARETGAKTSAGKVKVRNW